MRVGVHTSIAGALENAAHRAKKIGCDTFQMFSANPRGWQASELTTEECVRFREAVAGYKLAPVVVHDNYLINFAASDPLLRAKSVAAFRAELRRAVALGADYLVTHPGSAGGSEAAVAIKRCVESLRQAAHGMALDHLVILIENTAGQGTAIGKTLEEWAEIVHSSGRDLPVGACLDTAHCFAAGYAIHTARGLEDLLRELEATVRLERVKVIHANDSKAAFGSRTDRHQHIGRGQIGEHGFRRMLRHPKLRELPFICETPIDRPGDDRRNVRMMRKLAGVKLVASPQQTGGRLTTAR